MQKHYKLLITTGKKHSVERPLFVRAPDIEAAKIVQKKIRKSRLVYIKTISFEEYKAGVDAKYAVPDYELPLPRA